MAGLVGSPRALSCVPSGAGVAGLVGPPAPPPSGVPRGGPHSLRVAGLVGRPGARAGTPLCYCPGQLHGDVGGRGGWARWPPSCPPGGCHEARGLLGSSAPPLPLAWRRAAGLVGRPRHVKTQGGWACRLTLGLVSGYPMARVWLGLSAPPRPPFWCPLWWATLSPGGWACRPPGIPRGNPRASVAHGIRVRARGGRVAGLLGHPCDPPVSAMRCGGRWACRPPPPSLICRRWAAGVVGCPRPRALYGFRGGVAGLVGPPHRSLDRRW